jgi:hypothetical protein
MPARLITRAIIPAHLIILPQPSPQKKSTTASQFTISDTEYAAHLGTHPTTTVNVYDKPTMTLLGSSCLILIGMTKL